MSRMNESRHLLMMQKVIEITYEQAVSNMDQSCHIRMSHVTYEPVDDAKGD